MSKLQHFWWGDREPASFHTAWVSALLIGITAIALSLYQGGASNQNIHHTALPSGVTMIQPSLYRIDKGTHVSVCKYWATNPKYNQDGSVIINCESDQHWNIPLGKIKYTPWHEFGEAVWIFWAAWGGIGVLALADGLRVKRQGIRRKKSMEAINRRNQLEKELGIGV